MVSRLTNRLAAIAGAVLLAAALAARSSAQSRPANSMAGSVDATPSSPTGPLTLEMALDLALKTHPDLRVASADLGVARADSAFARLRSFNPSFELQGARGGQTLGSGAEATVDLGISQELELWEKRGSRQSVATARSVASAAEWRARSQAIASDVRATYERTRFLAERMGIVDELAELDRRVVLSTQSRVRDGSMTPLSGRLTELDLFRLEAQGRRARSDYRQGLVALGLAIGRELPESTRLSGDAEADSLRAPEDVVVALALRVRETGEVLRRQLAVRQAELRLAKREALPNLTLGFGLTRERRSLSADDFTGAPAIVGGITGARATDNLWTARVSAPLPLWQRNQAGRARASAEIVRSQSEYDRFHVRTSLEVIGAVRRFQDAAGLYRLYLGRSARVRQDLALIREAYADGRIPLDTYLTQKGRLVDTLLAQLESGDAYWDARGELEAAVGLDLEHLNLEGTR